jgi:hypothetical protein
MERLTASAGGLDAKSRPPAGDDGDQTRHDRNNPMRLDRRCRERETTIRALEGSAFPPAARERAK